MTLDWTTAASTMAVATPLVVLLGIYIRYLILQNNETLKNWINGSFMRAKEVEAKLEAIEARLDAHSERFRKHDYSR